MTNDSEQKPNPLLIMITQQGRQTGGGGVGGVSTPPEFWMGVEQLSTPPDFEKNIFRGGWLPLN